MSTLSLKTRLNNLLETKAWRVFITSIIIINALILGVDTYVSDEFLSDVLHAADSVCLWIFVVEIVIRIYVHRLHFFTCKERGWNWFDFIVVAISLFGDNELSILRALRVVRLLRLLSIFPSMRVVSNALLHTLPSMASICVLLFIFYYIYGVMCVNLFGKEFPQYFGTLDKSFFTLFQIMTLEGWSENIVRPIMKVYPYAWIIFVSYILIATFVVLNLVLAVIVDSLAELKEGREKMESAKDSKESSKSDSNNNPNSRKHKIRTF